MELFVQSTLADLKTRTPCSFRNNLSRGALLIYRTFVRAKGAKASLQDLCSWKSVDRVARIPWWRGFLERL